VAEEIKDETRDEKSSAFLQEGIIKQAKNIEIDPKEYKWKVFLAGPSGSGKTVAMTTLPGKKLLIDCDGRSESVVGFPDVDIYTCYEQDHRSPKAWNKLETLRKVIIGEVIKGIFPYDSIIWDGLTMMGRYSLNWALLLDSKRGLGGAPAQQHYLPQMDNLAKYILSTKALPLHIGYTGHLELFSDEAMGTQRFLPKITGKLRTEISNWFNETYYSYRATDSGTGKLRYYWLTKGSGRQEFFKTSLNTLGAYWEDPIELDFSSENPIGFQDLWYRRFGEKYELNRSVVMKGGEEEKN